MQLYRLFARPQEYKSLWLEREDGGEDAIYAVRFDFVGKRMGIGSAGPDGD
jgi:hypothetical protein